MGGIFNTALGLEGERCGYSRRCSAVVKQKLASIKQLGTRKSFTRGMIIQTLATCHNRKQKTLASLRDLTQQELPDNCILRHTIVDDGSTDGTSEAVSHRFPEVEIIHGHGSLYWAGGMRYGWEHSIKDHYFDYLFVYNDDVRLNANALNHLISTSSCYLSVDGASAHAVTGAFTDSAGETTTYSGAIKTTSWHPFRVQRIEPPDTGFNLVDTMNMNGALISRAALLAAGFLSDFFVHGGADFEYGLKLNKVGGKVLLASGHIGSCDRNSTKGTELEPGITLVERYRRLLSVKGQPPAQRLKYCRQYAPWFWPIIWASPYIKLPVRHSLKKIFFLHRK